MHNVTPIPRTPFLPHSERLLQYLLRHANAHGSEVLEVGCGEQSCLVPFLARIWPEATLHQIDVRPEVIPLAQKHNPSGTVRQMNIADMSAFEGDRFDAVVAMSVFDQNPLNAMPAIAREIYRVLRPGGIFAYIHNEELNAPATSASLMSTDPPMCLLPNDRWAPDNDLEYCMARMSEVRHAFDTSGHEFDMLRQYVDALHPTPEQLRQAGGKIEVPIIRQLNFPVLKRLRESVARLRPLIQLTDCSTPSLLNDRIEQRLLQPAHGFTVVESGMFELWRNRNWRDIFTVRPDERYFVRNVAKLGYSSVDPPQPFPGYSQSLANPHDPADDEVTLVSYQYGAVARKGE